MVILFISAGCKSCENLLKQLSDEWTKRIIILEIKYDQDLKIYRAYSRDGEPIGDEAPVSSIPTLCFIDEEKVFTGYEAIVKRLINEQ